MKVYAVIPAAGLGLRLNIGTPKILAPITETQTTWSILRSKLLPLVDHINVIVSPTGESLIRHALQDDINLGLVSVSIQSKPIGMGDAIFCGFSVWSRADVILIVWGDQIFVSSETLKKSIQMHRGGHQSIVLPLVWVANPYVEYSFSDDEQFLSIKQSREGDNCSEHGFSDVGTFILSVNDLLPAWHDYVDKIERGHNTKEINFLPFLTFLSRRKWQIQPVFVKNSDESRGINTPDDLAYFQNIFSKEGSI